MLLSKEDLLTGPPVWKIIITKSQPTPDGAIFSCHSSTQFHFAVKINKLRIRICFLQTMGFKTLIFRSLTRTTTLSAGLFAGGALYTTIVEHPSRRRLETKQMYLVWKESLVNGKPMLLLVLISSLSGIAAYLLKPKAKGIPWLLAGGAMAAILPYTALVMWPFAIGPIYDKQRADKKGGEYTRRFMEKWNSLNTLRTVVSLVVFAGCGYTMTTK